VLPGSFHAYVWLPEAAAEISVYEVELVPGPL